MADAPQLLLLDWRSREHWSSRRKPCRLCDEPTQLRDESGKPCHKSCAETELMTGMRDATGPAGSTELTRARERLRQDNAARRANRP